VPIETPIGHLGYGGSERFLVLGNVLIEDYFFHFWDWHLTLRRWAGAYLSSGLMRSGLVVWRREFLL
jgi:hypothetical protein